jgi:deoxyribonuclease (pyrimidine dimer)
MTRINVVDPRTLHSKHLLAEYRELPRVFKLVEAAERRGSPVRVPQEYLLGAGHVTFFYNKLKYLSRRFESIVDECHRRGFNITHHQVPAVDVKQCWWNDYEPTPQAVAINAARIKERAPK